MPDDGCELKRAILALLPDGWDPAGRRVLDFGCVEAELLGHFAGEARAAGDVVGVDGDRGAVARLARELSPPLRVLAHDGVAPIALADGSFDLAYSVYEFTRVGDRWAQWALEIHRLLAPSGLLVVGVMPPRGLEALLGEEWSVAQVGHLISSVEVAPRQYRTVGFVSPWWLAAHWGRAFEVLGTAPVPIRTGEPAPQQRAAGALRAAGLELVAMRRREVTLDVGDLVAPEPAEPRELAAALHQARVTARELERLRLQAGAELDQTAGERDERAGEGAHLRGVAEAWEEQADWLAMRLAETVGALQEAQRQAEQARADARDATAASDATRQDAAAWAWQAAQAREQAAAAAAGAARLQAALEVVYASRSWRLTAPLRAGAGRGRRSPGGVS